jgi:hypothetical protein
MNKAELYAEGSDPQAIFKFMMADSQVYFYFRRKTKTYI